VRQGGADHDLARRYRGGGVWGRGLVSKDLFAFRPRRFLALAPSLFRQDAVFRYAVIGGGWRFSRC